MRRILLSSLGALLFASMAVAQSYAQTYSNRSVPTPNQPAPAQGAPASVTWEPQTALGAGIVEDNPVNYWISAELLHYWLKPAPLPVPLLTTDTSGGFAGPLPGISSPITQVLVGNSHVDFRDGFNGIRLSAGYDLDPSYGVAIGATALDERTLNTFLGSDAAGRPVLYRPFVNLTTNNINGGFFIAFPGQAAGEFLMRNSSEFDGFNFDFVSHVANDGSFKVDLLAGFRSLMLKEQLSINDNYLNIPPNGGAGFGAFFGGKPLVIGDSVATFDKFHTRSTFYGGHVGVQSEYQVGGLTVIGNGSIGVGDTNQIVEIAGSSTLTKGATGVKSSLPGGTLALPSNSGRLEHNELSFVPELGVKLAYDFTPGFRAFLGYDFLYWTHVARPGDQIRLVVNDTQSPQSPRFNPALPAPNPPPPGPDRANFYLMGLNAGVTFRF